MPEAKHKDKTPAQEPAPANPPNPDKQQQKPANEPKHKKP
ncbi:hypothetical protein ABIA38_007455 [Embleya sp. AB8]